MASRRQKPSLGELMREIIEDLRVNLHGGILTHAMIVCLQLGRYSRRMTGLRSLPTLPIRLVTALAYRFLSIAFNCSVPFGARIGRRIRWPHGFSGIFITRDAVIGDDCTILHQVTIGSNLASREQHRASPVIGKSVMIGAGAKLIGRVIVGDEARIGSQALVIGNVPPGAKCFAPVAVVKFEPSQNSGEIEC